MSRLGFQRQELVDVFEAMGLKLKVSISEISCFDQYLERCASSAQTTGEALRQLQPFAIRAREPWNPHPYLLLVYVKDRAEIAICWQTRLLPGTRLERKTNLVLRGEKSGEMRLNRQ